MCEKCDKFLREQGAPDDVVLQSAIVEHLLDYLGDRFPNGLVSAGLDVRENYSAHTGEIVIGIANGDSFSVTVGVEILSR